MPLSAREAANLSASNVLPAIFKKIENSAQKGQRKLFVREVDLTDSEELKKLGYEVTYLPEMGGSEIAW